MKKKCKKWLKQYNKLKEKEGEAQEVVKGKDIEMPEITSEEKEKHKKLRVLHT